MKVKLIDKSKTQPFKSVSNKLFLYLNVLSTCIWIKLCCKALMYTRLPKMPSYLHVMLKFNKTKSTKDCRGGFGGSRGPDPPFPI